MKQKREGNDESTLHKHIALASIQNKMRIQTFQRKNLDDLYHIAFSFVLSLPGGVQETVSFLIQPF